MTTLEIMTTKPNNASTWKKPVRKGGIMKSWRYRQAAALGALALGAFAPVSALGADRAGVAAAVVGDVTVTGEPRPNPVSAESGMDMLRFDRVVTQAESRMQILLLDKTNFSVGPQSELVIDEFVYDPNKGVGEVTAEFVEGVFRYVSGNVGRTEPENVEVKTPAGTIGVRGTALFANRDSDTGEVFVGLLGPGGQNNAGLTGGGFVFENGQGRTTVLRSGFGVRAASGQAPSAPVRIPESMIADLQASFQGRPGGRPAAPAGDEGGGVDGDGVDGGLDAPGKTAGQETAAAQALGNAFLQRMERGDRVARARDLAVEDPESRSREAFSEMTDGDRGANQVMPAPDALFAELTWGDVGDIDLHVTGPNASGESRFHVFFANRNNGGTPPTTVLDNDFTGSNGSEAAYVNSFNEGGPYRFSAFSFGAPGLESTVLANESNAMMALIQGGAIERGPGGSAVINGELLERITVPTDQAGNTWVGFEVDPATQQIDVINQITSSDGSAAVE